MKISMITATFNKAALSKSGFEYEWTAVKATFYKAQVKAQVERDCIA